MSKAPKAKAGDLYEISTKKGLAYIQCIRTVPEWGTLIGALQGFHRSRPSPDDEIASLQDRFITFYPVDYAAKSGVIEFVGTAEVDSERYPDVFRVPGHIDRDGAVRSWYLVEGNRETQIRQLTEEIRRLPIKEVLNHEALVFHIETDWRPERYV